METIKASVRNGRIETDDPLKLPDGTRLLIVPSTANEEDGDWDNSSQGIATWLEWYDSLEPLVFSPAEREALQQDQAARKHWELAQVDERTEKLRRLWE